MAVENIYSEWKERDFCFMINHGRSYLGQFFIEKLTEKAVLFEAANGHSFWCPKSLIDIVCIEDVENGDIFNSVTVNIPHIINLY